MPDSLTFPTKTMGDVIISWDSDDQITVHDLEGRKIGNLTTRTIEEADESEVHLITNMYCDGPDGSGAYKCQGIMRRCIQLLSADFGYQVAARPIGDGETREDGSHLTEEAPGFIAKMIAEGLVFPYSG